MLGKTRGAGGYVNTCWNMAAEFFGMAKGVTLKGNVVSWGGHDEQSCGNMNSGKFQEVAFSTTFYPIAT